MVSKQDLILAQRHFMRMAMDSSATIFRDTLLPALLYDARTGSVEALGRLLEVCRSYLLTIARQELAASLRGKVDAADVVQETFIEALRDFSAFRGETERQLLGWLRGILRHNLADLTKHFGCRCRCLNQEVPLPDHEHLAAACIRAYPTGDGPICEQLIAQEQRRALDAALQRLPPLYRRVIQLHFGERYSFTEIAKELQRSPEAVRKLVSRTVQRLRREMRAYAEV
jgi:RNA polymerase sigma-70 factor (ECF subfamily)